MSDDIDIEEHDLLQLPELRSLFPDLARVKQEVEDATDNHTGDGRIQKVLNGPDVREVSHPRDSQPALRRNPKKSFKGIQLETPKATSSEGSINGELNIKSSGPARSQEKHIVAESFVSDGAVSEKQVDTVKEMETDILQTRSEICGSGWTATGPEQRCFQAVITLQNWGPLLDESKLYCLDCKILFGDQSAIDLHNRREHKSGKITGKRPSPKPQKNTLTKKTIVKHIVTPTTVQTESPPAEHTCQLCNALAATKEDLIEHLYDHAIQGSGREPQTYDCNFCVAKFTRKIFLENHLWSHARTRISSIANTESPQDWTSSNAKNPTIGSSPSSKMLAAASASSPSLEDRIVSREPTLRTANDRSVSEARNNEAEFQCPVCSLAFDTTFSYIKHTRSAHGLSGRAQSTAQLEPMKTSSRYTIAKRIWNRGAVALDFVLKCSKCDIHFPASKNMPLSSDHDCLVDCTIDYCDICHRKFSKRDLSLHLDVHTACKELRVIEHKEHSQRGRILHKCEQCGLCCRTMSGLTWHFCSTKKWTHCTKCDHKIDNTSNMHLHRKDHEKLAAGGKDFIVIHYRLIKIISPIPKKPRKKPIRDTTTWSRRINLQGRHMKIVRCNKCESHLTDSRQVVIHHKRLDDCNVQGAICKYCGLRFVHTCIRPHLETHERSPKRLYAWDFDVETVSGARVQFDLQAALRSLPQCERCKVIFNSFKSVCREWNCKNVKTKKCKRCDATFTSGAYLWHVVLHAKIDHRDPKTRVVERKMYERKLSTEDKFGPDELNLTLLRCTKCKLHSTEDDIGEHYIRDCSTAGISVCLRCGLTFSQQSLEQHEQIHRRSGVPLTMKSFTILSTKDRRPVGPERCPFPACVRCGVVYEGPDGTHQSYADCSKDRTPRLQCSTCHLTFTSGAYPLHLGYYGCTGAPESSPDLPAPTLYKCRKCPIYHLTVPNARKHCRKGHSGWTRTKVCDVCEYEFTSKAYTQHRLLHHELKDYKRSDFVTETVSRIFAAPKVGTMKNKILLGGIPRKTNVGSKMDCVQTGTVKSLEIERPSRKSQTIRRPVTLHKCTACDVHYLNENTLLQHLMYEHTADKLDKSKIVRCQTCDLTFKRYSLVKHNENHHKQHDYGFDDFNIVEISLEDFVARRKRAKATLTVKKTAKKKKPKNYKFGTKSLFRCTPCGVHYLSMKSLKGHLSNHATLYPQDISPCPQCDLVFTKRTLIVHLRIHHQQGHYSTEDFDIYDSRP